MKTQSYCILENYLDEVFVPREIVHKSRMTKSPTLPTKEIIASLKNKAAEYLAKYKEELSKISQHGGDHNKALSYYNQAKRLSTQAKRIAYA